MGQEEYGASETTCHNRHISLGRKLPWSSDQIWLGHWYTCATVKDRHEVIYLEIAVLSLRRVAQLLKCFPCKHEDLSLIPRTHVGGKKEQSVVL